MNKRIILHGILTASFVGIGVWFFAECKRMLEDPTYVSVLVGYEPLPWYWVVGLFAFVVLFVPWSCNGIPLIVWVWEGVVDTVKGWRERWLGKKKETKF